MACRFSSSLAVLAAVVLVAPAASAHIDLVVPSPRHADPLLDQKDGPCGVAGSPRSDAPTVLQPGEVVTVSWSEPIDHDSHCGIL